MITSTRLLASAALSACLLTAAHAESPSIGGFTISGSAGVVSDYRFRGISQTDKNPAFQAGLTVSHESGFYAGAWGSHVDDRWYEGSQTEVDPYVGWSKEFAGLKLDTGVTLYTWPGSHDTSYLEPYVSLSYSIATVDAKVSAAYVPSGQSNFDPVSKDDNLYLAADASVGLPLTGLKAVAHVGREQGPYYNNKIDWKLGVTYTLLGHLEFGLAYIDTDLNGTSITSLPVPQWGKGTVVGSVTASF